MSRRDGKTTNQIIEELEKSCKEINEVVKGIFNQYGNELNSTIEKIKELLEKPGGIVDQLLEHYILELSSILFFTAQGLEEVGIKEDMIKMIRQNTYNALFKMNKNGTLADRNAICENATQKEAVVVAIYTRSYKQIKQQLEAGYEVLNCLKKVMNKRIVELEMSNSRYNEKRGRE